MLVLGGVPILGKSSLMEIYDKFEGLLLSSALFVGNAMTPVIV